MQHIAPAMRGRSSFFARSVLAKFGAMAVLGFHLATAVAAELIAVREAGLPKAVDRQLHAAIAAHKDESVLINFWATWCEPCREELPSLQRLADRWRDKGLVVITVAVADNSQRVADFLWESDIRLPVIHDVAQGLSRPWGARAVPTTLVLDRRHRIRLRGQGVIDWDAVAIDQQLQVLTSTARKDHHGSP